MSPLLPFAGPLTTYGEYIPVIVTNTEGGSQTRSHRRGVSGLIGDMDVTDIALIKSKPNFLPGLCIPTV
jgi:hypothetical protein